MPPADSQDGVALDGYATQVRQFDAQRHAVRQGAPVLGLDDGRSANLIAWPIEATVGEQIRRQPRAIDHVRHASDVEPRQVERA